jgi:hypothetical protein
MKAQNCWAFLALSALCLCGVTFGLGQSPADSQVLPSSPVRIITVAEALKDHGIDLAPASLIAALKNSDPYVRSLAANMLAQDRILEAIPQIESALAAETDPQASIGISGALSALNDPKGAKSLQATCMDSKLPIRFIIESASHLQLLHLPSGACADTILNALKVESNASYRDYALYPLAAMYREVPPDQARRILAAIEGLIKDPAQQMHVHLMASHALAQIGASSSIEALNAAILREHDPNVKARMQVDLDTLQKKQ